MLITGLRTKNWGCHPELNMVFKPGLNGIVGPNGSGKSTVLDGIRFGVANASISAGQRSDNLRTGQKSGFVEVDFTHGSSTYTVNRQVATSKCKMTCGEQVWSKAAEIDEFLESLLQTKIDALLNNVFVGQHAIDDILFKTNTERLKEFQDTFGLTRMADAYRVLSTEIASSSVTPGLVAQRDLLVVAAKEAHKELAAARADLQEVMAQINDRMWVSEKLVQHESLTSLREVREKALQAVAVITKNMAQLDEQITDLRTKLAELRLQIAMQSPQVVAAVTLSGQYATSKAQRKTLSDELQRIAAIPVPTESAAGLQPEIDKAAERQQKLGAMLTGSMPLPQLPGDAELAAEQLELTSKLKEDVGADIQMLAANLKREQETLQTFANGSCPTCLRPMESFDPSVQRQKVADVQAALTAAQDARNERIRLIKQRIAVLDDDLAKRKTAALAAVNKAFREAQAAHQGLAQRATALRNCEAAYAAAQQRGVEVQNQLREVPVILDEAARAAEEVVRANTERQRQVQEFETTLAVVTSRREAHEGERKRVQASMPQVNNADLMSDEEYTRARAIETELQQLFSTKRDVETRIGIADAKTQSQEQTVVQLNEQIGKESKVAAWSRICERARDVIHVSGLPTLMMKEYAAKINKRIAYYLQIWEAPFRLFLDDSLSFRALFDTGLELPAARLSGGQKIVASTSFRLAMSDTFAKNVGLLILDEPTNHLDKENVTHLQQLLVKLKQTAGASQRQIIIVTHEEQLVGFFDHTIQLAKLA